MKVVVYVNKAKDLSGSWLKSCEDILKAEEINYKVIHDENLKDTDIADAMFVLGGDGTILNLTEYAARNAIPIIGINAGKLGFLTEFEQCEMLDAVKSLKNGELVKDERITMLCKTKNSSYYTLNDAVIQRIKVEDRGNNVTSLDVEIDDIKVEKIIGDGVTLSTPTGSTAYSLSAGGAILSPATKVFSITPIAAHSLNQRAIVYSSKSVCKVYVKSDCATGLFIDGIFAEQLQKGDLITIERAEFSTIFLRKKGFNFYKRLSQKLKDRTVDNWYDEKREIKTNSWRD